MPSHLNTTINEPLNTDSAIDRPLFEHELGATIRIEMREKRIAELLSAVIKSPPLSIQDWADARNESDQIGQAPKKFISEVSYLLFRRAQSYCYLDVLPDEKSVQYNIWNILSPAPPKEEILGNILTIVKSLSVLSASIINNTLHTTPSDLRPYVNDWLRIIAFGECARSTIFLPFAPEGGVSGQMIRRWPHQKHIPDFVNAWYENALKVYDLSSISTK